ncbi:MAG TPA: LpqB family beta-propeller domain-containing protein [Mycobacteriales bacterium]|nr:LpqB family beta-propeller domain-containing protein [Mycobacteriales bacterium]
MSGTRTGRRPLSARHPGVRAVAAALSLAALAACAGVPTSSTPRVVESVPRGGIRDEPDVRYQITPQAGESPADVVRDFLAAAGSPESQHFVARQYLTPQAARNWQDAVGAVVLARQPYTEERNSGREITIRADQVGRVDDAGSYFPVSQSYTYRFELQQVGGEWRINNPPSGVVVPVADFQTAYRRLNVYFLNQAENRVVPDPRWFSAPQASLPNLLLHALLQGPSASLQTAVRTDLNGISLASNVVRDADLQPDSDRVRVYLAGMDRLGPRMQAAASAQIIWTLNQLPLPGVQLFNEGQPLKLPGLADVQHIADWGGYDPDSLPPAASGYFVRNGAIWSTDGHALPGLGGYHARSVGVSTDLTALALVAPASGGMALYVGSMRGPLTMRLSAANLSAPSWGDQDTVWVVRNGTEILQVGRQGTASSVITEDLDQIGAVRVLRLSRDGARAALVAGPTGNRKLYVGAVNRKGGAALSQLTAIAPDLHNVVDVAWSTADQLVVLTRSGTSDAALHSVTVDGSTAAMVTTSGLPGPPSTLAAAPKMPMLAVAENGVWRLRDPQDAWTSVEREGNLLDSAPSYPG